MKVLFPIDPFKITQEFGVNHQVYVQFGLAGHNGWDIKTKYFDTPEGRRNILATQESTFRKKGFDLNGYGNYFEVLTQAGGKIFKHTFAHCHSIETFESKLQGETMAISDNTGFSTAAHLHWTVKEIDIKGNVKNYNNGYFGAINPQEYLDWVRSVPDSQQPPMDDKRPYWFDLMNKIIWDKPHEEITDDIVNSFVKEYPSQRLRSGLWDQLCIKAGFTGDSNVVTVDQLFTKIQEMGSTDTKFQQVKDFVNSL